MSETKTYTVDQLNENYSTYEGNLPIKVSHDNKTGIEISTNGKYLGYLHFINQVSVAGPRPGEKVSTNNSYGTEKHYQVYYYDDEGKKQVRGMNGNYLVTVTVQTSTGTSSQPSSASKSSSPPKSKSSSVSKSTSSSGSRSRSKSKSSGGRKKRRSSKRMRRRY